MRSRSLALLSIALLLLPLTGCTSGAAARVSANEAAVTLAANEGDPREVTEVTDARAGDTVATDADGRAELVFADGSLARLGADTRLVVEEVSSADEQRTVVALDVGRTWHRVAELVADDAAYEVETPVGTAAVTGTEFSVECTDEPVCRIVVFDGSVLFATAEGEEFPLQPFQQLTVPDPEGEDPVVLPYAVGAIEGDEWLSENFDAAEAAEPPATAASLAGEWTMESIGTSTSGPDRVALVVGAEAQRAWIIDSPVCDPVCVSAISSDSGAQLSLRHGAEDIRIVGTGVTGCGVTETGEVLDPDGFDTAFEYVLTVTDIDADGRATAATGTRTDTYTLRADADPACVARVQYPEATDTHDVTVTR